MYQSRNVADYWIFPNGESITQSLQSLLDSIGPEVEETVYFPRGTYILEAAGQLFFNGTNHRYCVKIPSNTKILLHPQAVLKLADGANATVFMNDGISGAGNVNIKISGGTIDGNRENQSGAPTGYCSGIQLHNVLGAEIKDLRFVNMYDYAMYNLGIYDSKMEDLLCEDSRGSGFHFGNDYEINGANARVQNSYFHNIRAFKCEGVPGPSAPGNPFIFCGDESYIGRVEVGTSINGIKIQNGTRNCHFHSLYAKGNLSANGAGVKIQGAPNSRVNKCSFGTLHGLDCDGWGVYLHQMEECSIDQIIAENSGLGTLQSNVQIGESISKVNIGSIISDQARNHGVEFHSRDTSHVNVDSIIAKNSSQGTRGNNSNVEMWSNNISIGKITSLDNQVGQETVRHSLMIRSDAGNIDIGILDAVGNFVSDDVKIDSQENVKIKTLRINGVEY